MILVFGRTGQVGRELARLESEARVLGREDADLTDPTACAQVIRRAGPAAVINAAAYTAVDAAEAEEELATRINGAAPGAMALACAELKIPFVHLSTDYVFDGSGTTPFRPEDRTGPLNAYGRSKLAGEKAVRDSGAVHAILRTSWVFSAHRGNFPMTMLLLAETRDRLAVVADQIGGPTPASAIARACVIVARSLQSHPEKGGTYHLAGAPDVSWADFAREIFRQTAKEVMVDDISTSSYPTAAKRPANSRLDCHSLGVFALTRPDWKTGLREMLLDLDTM